jgi:hypothetical protein
VVRRRRERAEDGEVVLVLVERREIEQLLHRRAGVEIPVPVVTLMRLSVRAFGRSMAATAGVSPSSSGREACSVIV